MRSEKPNMVELTLDVETVGGGTVVLKHGDRAIYVPATMLFEQYMGARLYKRVTVKIEVIES